MKTFSNTIPTEPKTIIQIVNGVPYIYEDFHFWDKNKKQIRHKRKCIGKNSPTGEFLPNNYYLLKLKDNNNDKKEVFKEPTVQPNKITPANRNYYGAVYLLCEIVKKTGLLEDLEICFPLLYNMLLSIVYYLVLESDSPMYRFEKWDHDHYHPHGKNISSQRISDLLIAISEKSKLELFRRQSQRRLEDGYLAYDTTSVSSTSKTIKIVSYGVNKDDDKLPQINLALLFGQVSGLPVYYRILPGNITDVTTIAKLLLDVDFLNLNNLKLVLDRGFFSVRNINLMYKYGHKFLIAMKDNIKFIAPFLAIAIPKIKDIIYNDYIHKIHHMMFETQWPYKDPDSPKDIVDLRKIYVHIYYDRNKETIELNNFEESLADIIKKINSGKALDTEQLKLGNKYLHLRINNECKIISFEYNKEAIKKHTEKFGIFILLSNDIANSVEAISVYRKRDMVEKAFEQFKEKLELRRTMVHSDAALEGKCFLHFLSLIVISYIHNHMSKNNLYKNYTLQTLLDKLDIIERFDYSDKEVHFSEITKKQEELYEALEIKPPNMP
jgi:transposase